MSVDEIFRNVGVASLKHPKPAGQKFGYGTAGFRMKADVLDSTIFRVGLLASLRSQAKGGDAVGVMLTASHNPVEDNGAKVVDPMGEMLEASWETLAAELANAPDEDVPAVCKAIVSKHGIDFNTQPLVFYAYDTRPSAAALVAALEDGLEAMGAVARSFGELSTPQLHHMVRSHNTGGTYGLANEGGYYAKMADAYILLTADAAKASTPVTVDGANGVGASKMVALSGVLGSALDVVVTNDGGGVLNHQCGADFVKVSQGAPAGATLVPLQRYASFDGDADRIVYYFADKDGTFQLLDGDRIATLAASFIRDLLDTIDLPLTMATVQTAYANGNSTKYLKETFPGMAVPYTCTGVKHLHHEALSYDVGVYFEANGHGTVLFNPSALQKLDAADSTKFTTEQHRALRKIRALIQLVNQTVGDALSDLLLVEGILANRGWGVEEWHGMYADLPNRLAKVKVADRAAFRTADADTRLTAPEGMQDGIQGIVAKYPQARSFVRPSGTEDVVRVYAEAATQEAADRLALEVAQYVHKNGGGQGPVPDRV